jgi:hypothetical protein
MAQGKRYKFGGSSIQILTGFGTPAASITDISNTNPAVVTDAAHGLTDGQVIQITGVVGMTEVNGGSYVVEAIDADSYELIGVNATGYGEYTSGGSVALATLSDFCELTGYNRTGGTSPEIDATTICSTAAEYEVGLPDFGTTQIDYNFAPQTAIQQAISNYYSGENAGEIIAVKVTLPNSGGESIQLGTIQQTSEQAAVNGLWTGSLTIRNTGPRLDFAA